MAITAVIERVREDLRRGAFSSEAAGTMSIMAAGRRLSIAREG